MPSVPAGFLSCSVPSGEPRLASFRLGRRCLLRLGASRDISRGREPEALHGHGLCRSRGGGGAAGPAGGKHVCARVLSGTRSRSRTF